jgi:hypothetical protein
VSISRPFPLHGSLTAVCVCGKAPKGYCTDGKLYHVECQPCKVITPKLSHMPRAVDLFRLMCDTIKIDRKFPTMTLLRSADNV